MEIPRRLILSTDASGFRAGGVWGRFCDSVWWSFCIFNLVLYHFSMFLTSFQSPICDLGDHTVFSNPSSELWTFIINRGFWCWAECDGSAFIWRHPCRKQFPVWIRYLQIPTAGVGVLRLKWPLRDWQMTSSSWSTRHHRSRCCRVLMSVWCLQKCSQCLF